MNEAFRNKSSLSEGHKSLLNLYGLDLVSGLRQMKPNKTWSKILEATIELDNYVNNLTKLIYPKSTCRKATLRVIQKGTKLYVNDKEFTVKTKGIRGGYQRLIKDFISIVKKEDIVHFQTALHLVSRPQKRKGYSGRDIGQLIRNLTLLASSCTVVVGETEIILEDIIHLDEYASAIRKKRFEKRTPKRRSPGRPKSNMYSEENILFCLNNKSKGISVERSCKEISLRTGLPLSRSKMSLHIRDYIKPHVLQMHNEGCDYSEIKAKWHIGQKAYEKVIFRA